MNLSTSIVSRLKVQHETIEDLTAGYSEEQLKMRIITDKWSVFENTAHLVLYQTVFQDRIAKILTGVAPAFERYVADTDPAFPQYLQLSWEELLTSLHTIREQISEQVITLPSDQLLLVGHHPKFGALTLAQWTEFFLLHEAHHLFTMFKLLRGGG